MQKSGVGPGWSTGHYLGKQCTTTNESEPCLLGTNWPQVANRRLDTVLAKTVQLDEAWAVPWAREARQTKKKDGERCRTRYRKETDEKCQLINEM